MPRESLKSKRARGIEVCKRISAKYSYAECALEYEGDPFKLCVAVMLSAQTTDKGVNKVTPHLWKEYPSVENLACARLSDVEEIVRPIGFYRVKAQNCIKMAQVLLSDFGGYVPKNMTDLQKLPGIGRKSANVVLTEAFGIVEGIAVDTHVFRVAHVLRLSSAKNPSQTEHDLLKILPHELWGDVNRTWILFGREICVARKPKCESCFLADLCPSCNAK